MLFSWAKNKQKEQVTEWQIPEIDQNLPQVTEMATLALG